MSVFVGKIPLTTVLCSVDELSCINFKTIIFIDIFIIIIVNIIIVSNTISIIVSTMFVIIIIIIIIINNIRIRRL